MKNKKLGQVTGLFFREMANDDGQPISGWFFAFAQSLSSQKNMYNVHVIFVFGGGRGI